MTTQRPDLSSPDGRWVFVERLGLNVDLARMKELAQSLPLLELGVEERAHETADTNRAIADREKDLEVELLDEPLKNESGVTGGEADFSVPRGEKKMLASERELRLKARMRERAKADSILVSLRASRDSHEFSHRMAVQRAAAERMEWQYLLRKLDLRGRMVSFLEK